MSSPIEDYSLTNTTPLSHAMQELSDYTVKNREDAMMLCGPLVAGFLKSSVRAVRAKRILEVGTYTGYSALAMAEVLPDDGELITLDISKENLATAQSHWDKSPHGKKIRAVLGPAGETLPKQTGPFDFVFIDADKVGYLGYLKGALERLAPNGTIVVDNCWWSGRPADPSVQDPDTNGIRAMLTWVRTQKNLLHCLLPIRDGLLVVQKN